ncbi:MAG: lycopene cyclase domain-containing protein [Acidimicrobiales bacterium]|nr:lycopene cyclase domain-containing protein [Acidimicrobiales bacterium]
MDRYQYLLLMGACVLVTLPLELVIGARVWRRPRRLATALVPAGVLFVAWDLWATATGTWSFNDRYTIGVELPGGMAIEELVFFTVVPVCGLLTLEAVRTILRRLDRRRAAAAAPQDAVR